MKKMMVALAAVAMAFCAQAVSVNWAVRGGIQIDGDFSTGVGNTADAGWTAYLFDANVVTRDAMLTALGQADNITAFNALTAASTTTTESDGAITAVNGVSMTVDSSNNINAYLVLLQGDEVAEGVDVNVSGVFTTASTDPVPTTFNLSDAEDYVDMTSGWTTFTAVPEPTSGLLLLLGMAGLALRRRRA